MIDLYICKNLKYRFINFSYNENKCIFEIFLYILDGFYFCFMNFLYDCLYVMVLVYLK